MSKNWLGAIWKPKGVSSFKVLGELKKDFGTRKVGHMGTLDPLASGVLPVAVGKYTKLIPYVNLLPKVYEVEITFGVPSQTLDAEGVSSEELEDLRSKDWEPEFSEDDILKVVRGMIGKVEQVPPVFSALKIDGVRAYKLAREGSDVEMKARQVECFGVDLLKVFKFEGLWKACLRVTCGKGYYVRSFVRDLCAELGVDGYMSELVRTQVGEFKKNSMEVSDWKSVLDVAGFVDLNLEEVERFRNGLEVVRQVDFEGTGVGMFEGGPVCILESEMVDDKFILRVKKNI